MCQAVVAPLPQPTAPADRRHFAPAYAAEVRKLKADMPDGTIRPTSTGRRRR